MTECPGDSCNLPVLTRNEKRRNFKHDESNAAEIYQGLRDVLFYIGKNYFAFTFDLAFIQGNLRDAWDELIHAAKRIPSSGAEHDRLVTLILELRELGSLGRKNKEKTEEEAIMPNGQRLWIDLPYLGEELYASWTRESATFTSQQRQSLAVLSGKLCAFGACAPHLAESALWLLKEALEMDRPVSSTEDPASEGSSPTIAELLPACLEWLKYSKFRLAKLSLENYSPTSRQDDGELTSPGPLIAKDGVKIENEGFSLARWLFWRQRLGELHCHGGEDIVKPARACFEEMVCTGLAMGIDIPGERRFLDKTYEAIAKEVASRPDGGCVGIEDIEIDPTWAFEDRHSNAR